MVASDCAALCHTQMHRYMTPGRIPVICCSEADYGTVEQLAKIIALNDIRSVITQIQCMNGKLYVSPIMDCFDGEILALRIADNMRKELCTATLDSMVLRFPQTKGAILHSDRGSQYTSDAFRDLLEQYEMKQSLSGVDHCYDNARMESFFATLKKELIYRLPVYRMTIDEVKAWIFQYVFGYYNRIRVTTVNPGGWPPSVYREMYMHTVAAA